MKRQSLTLLSKPAQRPLRANKVPSRRLQLHRLRQPIAPQPNTAPPSPVTPAAPTVTVSQRNALGKAKSYLDYTAFSHDGLVAQLEYEQFSAADAIYGADNSGADWNEQAAKKTKEYMDFSSFSHGSLISQLEYEKFTPAQATYGAFAVGL